MTLSKNSGGILPRAGRSLESDIFIPPFAGLNLVRFKGSPAVRGSQPHAGGSPGTETQFYECQSPVSTEEHPGAPVSPRATVQNRPYGRRSKFAAVLTCMAARTYSDAGRRARAAPSGAAPRVTLSAVQQWMHVSIRKRGL